VFTITKKYLTVDGVTLAYEEYGHGEAVIFLHGFGESSFSWRSVAQTISRQLHRRCICLDLMGFGASEKPLDEIYTLERQAYLISGFIKEMGLKSLSLAGHSYGGGVCLILVGQLSTPYPFSVDTIVLVDTICYPQQFPGFIKYLRIPILRWLALNLIPARTLARLTLGLCYASKDKVTDESVYELSSALKSEGAEEALIATAEKILPEEMDSFISSYKTIQIPTFILWGAKDTIVPLKLGERLHSEIPSSTMVILDDCGHIPQEEFPEETAKLLIDFLSKGRQ
jgi:pimeloyl-ACP methyl ester carboxylesterase